MRPILVTIIVFCQSAVVAAQAPPPPHEEEDAGQFGLRENVAKLFRSFSLLSDWDTHSTYIVGVEKTYDRNGWDSEADAFSMELVREVNTFPPWMPFDRFNRAVEMLGERYDLDAEQETAMRQTLLRTSNTMFQKHSGRIMQYAVEAIQTRAAGEPFTPDQVARWVRLAEPVFQDGRTQVNAAAQTMMANLRPDQREIVQRDLDAMNGRLDDVEVMSARWVNGEWDPADWGMEDDPIQVAGAAQPTAGETATSSKQGAAERETVAKKTPPATPKSSAQHAAHETPVRPRATAAEPRAPAGETTKQTGPVVKDDDAWARYVRQFIAKYKLDEAQQVKAWKIYRDVKGQGDKHRSRYGQQIEATRKRAASATDAKSKAAVKELETKLAEHLNRLFENLEQRLDRLPTRAQRRDAGPGNPGQPTSRKAKKPVNPVENDGP